MDVFRLRNQVVGDYSSYIGSFLKILDSRIDQFVKDKLVEGVLWPDPLLQLSPAYQSAQTVEQLVKEGILHPSCGNLFRAKGKSLLLHQHQRTAIDIASQGQNYVVTTGTGSGKSLTYMVPIFDYILRHHPEQGKVRAIIVYPMNALINSQEQALDRFVENLGGRDNCPVKYDRYTGQEKPDKKREIQNNPPHILLTNYVMLELMLTRPEERAFVEAASSALQFLVLDELHTYRGRQGADVALLVRRLRERCGNPDLQFIGTSATMSTGATRLERAEAVAEVASKIFGSKVAPEHVVDETLRRTLAHSLPATPNTTVNSNSNTIQQSNKLPELTPEALRAVLVETAQIPELLDWETLRQNPLAIWIEDHFGLEVENDGHLRRREPITLMEGARQLAEFTGVDLKTCSKKLRQIFNAGSKVRSPEDIPGFAFKLHQFFSQGGSVYATVESPPDRFLTLEGQLYAPGEKADKFLFPLVFCRECGQEHYLCTYYPRQEKITPRPPLSRNESTSPEAVDGYLLTDQEGFWSDDQLDLLPENWFKELKRGRELKMEYAAFKPRHLLVQPDGNLLDPENLIQQNSSTSEVVNGWFIPVPFLTCLRCGEVYTKRQGDFSKLSRLSSEGRSTATTLLSLSAITQMRKDEALPDYARKLLSFTDNRQDASLQAGHFNDFVEVGLLRAAIYRALKQAPQGLKHTEIATCTVDELQLPEAVYARETSFSKNSQLWWRNREALQELIEYRIYEDLRRGWRLTQPNLEQCGLLILDYVGLDKICTDAENWKAHSLLWQATPQTRALVVRALLDYMRRELAISVKCLERRQQDALVRKVRAALKEPWAFDETEIPYYATSFVLPGVNVAGRGERSLGINTSLGRFLKSRQTWPTLSTNLDQEEYNELVLSLVEVLRGNGFLIKVEAEQGPAVQVRSDSMIWRAGDGLTLPRDPIRTRRMNLNYEKANKPNKYFGEFYKTATTSLLNIEGREHTGQVDQKKREDREDAFRKGDLSALFCSPTMELGIDIADLNVVHLRNVPPTPANYAQRSGRAGRSGQPALVATYCSVGSGHDQYFFRRPRRMVAGAVVPPRIDLGNEELVRAHIHAVWLGVVGLQLGRSMIEVVDTADPANNYPLLSEVKLALELNPSQVQKCLEECNRILSSSAIAQKDRNGWYSEEWLQGIINQAPIAFDRACDRWRELYSAAEKQLQEARAVMDRRYQSRGASNSMDADEARRREFEALRQKDLLCNTSSSSQQGDTDFYPYRYFASEGFLPGYNFPRLPVQAFLSTSRDSGTFLARPRFLALTEFGPRNVIYHEGGKYRVTKVILPGGSASSRMVTAKLCKRCGYFHEGQSSFMIEMCEHCNTRLDGDSSLTTSHLFEMTTVSTQRIERITSEEEERTREGYFVTSHFRFAGPNRTTPAKTFNSKSGSQEEELLDLCYASAATLWRINHRWRRSNTEGFTLDLKKGIWAKKPGDELDNAIDADNSQLLSGVRLMVRDTRNILLIQPEKIGEDDFLASLQYALQRGIEAIFQVEEQELVSERVGLEGQRRILFWEAAEGGVGVLARLVEEPKALAEVARAALEICHFDPATGAESGDVTDCGQACYRCLLSYSNQVDHTLLKRYLVRDLLLELANSDTKLTTPANAESTNGVGQAATSQFDQLYKQTVPGSFARKVLEYLQATNRRLPDSVNPAIDGVQIKSDFYFEKGLVCLFCDEVAPSSEVRALRYDLYDLGYRMIALRGEQDLETQLNRYSDIFSN